MPLSTLHVLVMMIGELNFGETFVDTSSNQNPSNPFPSVAYICLFLCLFLLSVGLMNLLVGKTSSAYYDPFGNQVVCKFRQEHTPEVHFITKLFTFESINVEI